MKTLRAISAIALAFLVLVSSTSFMIGMHFCMGEVQNVAVFTKAEGCEKEKSQPPCHRHMKAPCCDDETIVHKANDLKPSVADGNIVAPVPAEIEQPTFVISEIIPSAPVSRRPYVNYDPPLRSCDITVEQQVFLI